MIRMSARLALGVLVCTVAACRLDSLDVTGKSCPCPAALVCDTHDNVCVPLSTLDLAPVIPDLLPPSTNAFLGALSVSVGVLTPAFSPNIASYTVEVPLGFDALTVVGTAAGGDAMVAVADAVPTPGSASRSIDLQGVPPAISVVVTARAGNTFTYLVTVVRFEKLAAGLLDTSTYGSALVADGETIVAGAGSEHSCATGIDGDPNDFGCVSAGGAFVFVRDASGWSRQAYVKPAYTQAHQLFGESLALAGDRLIVGSSGDPSCATGVGGNPMQGGCASGAAYVFERTGAAWSQDAYLKPSVATGTTAFMMGYAVALAGDVIAVGAPGDASCTAADPSDTGCANAGAVLVFTKSNGSWAQTAYVKAAYPRAGGTFGSVVALTDDALAVGAPLESSCASGVGGDQTGTGCTSAGAAYVFSRSGSMFTQEAYLKASKATAYTIFGASLALEGSSLVVGELAEASCKSGADADPTDTGCPGAGAAYAFLRTGTTWAQEAFLKASNPTKGSAFGAAIALHGDTLVVGAPDESGTELGVDPTQTTYGTSFTGAMYVLQHAAGTWTQTAYLKADDLTSSAQLGAHVAISDPFVAGYAPGTAGPTVGGLYAYPRVTP